MFQLSAFQKAIREENLDGWLFYNFQHRDPLTNQILCIDPEQSCSRRWLYLIPSDGEPCRIVHGIESHILDHLPGEKRCYHTRQELLNILSAWNAKAIAVLYDPDIAVLSTLDAGMYDLLIQHNWKLHKASALIQRTAGLFQGSDFIEHQQTARKLYDIVNSAWQLILDRISAGLTLYEGCVQDHIMDCFKRFGLITNHPPIVAFGPHSADPHYAPPSETDENGFRGKPLQLNEVIQIDLWAKKPQSVYADISWVGYYGQNVPQEVTDAFTCICEARNLVTSAVQKAFVNHEPITGAALDRLAREYLIARGCKAAIRHRTGHGIDRECHGSGVNLDSVEFPDSRFILEGSCFSVEPGLYFSDFGLRTEINIYIKDGVPVISGGKPQRTVLQARPVNSVQEQELT